MRLYYLDLIGKQVVDADGVSVGRIRDLLAERRGESLCVTTIAVGELALAQRVAFRLRRKDQARHRHDIPWSLIERFDGPILRLRVKKSALARPFSRESGA